MGPPVLKKDEVSDFNKHLQTMDDLDVDNSGTIVLRNLFCDEEKVEKENQN